MPLQDVTATTADSSAGLGIPSVPGITAQALADLRALLWPLLSFEAAFKGAALLLGVIGTALVISPLIASTGRFAVTNTDIMRFLLSPAGLAVVFLLVFSMFLASLVEHVGVIVIGAIHLQGKRVTARRTLAALRSVFIRLTSFSALTLVNLAMLCAPFVVIAAITYLLLLSSHDINYYLANRPPGWYAAIAIGTILLTVLLAKLMVNFVTSVFVLPILLVGRDPTITAAARESRERAHGARARIGLILIGWHLLGAALGFGLLWGFARLCGMALNSAGWHAAVLIPLVAALLVCQAALIAVISFLVVTVHGLLILRLYLARGGSLATAEAAATAPSIPTSSRPRGVRFAARARKITPRLFLRLGSRTAFALGILLFATYTAVGLPRRLDLAEQILVVAHRGFSQSAPENTLSAFREAIDAGADLIELDVQQTSDGAVVIIHDRDLMRLAGDPRKIADITLAEARKLDLAKFSAPKYAGERIATLAEAIALARDKVRLQIELKYYGKDTGLARKVADIIRNENFESQCEVSSLAYDALLLAKKHNPQLKLVALVTYALGDPGRLEVDALSVNTSVLTDRLIRAAKARHKQLYAWTVDDPKAMLRLVERGVGGIVTNHPDHAARIRRERDAMTDAERRLMAARYLLGLEPEIASKPDLSPDNASRPDAPPADPMAGS